jgi:CheY-like chemotaxis protein
MDDEEYILDVTSESLAHLGYSAEVTVNGEEAIEKYVKALHKQDRFDVLIMDLTIPGGVGGVEALEHIRAIDPEVKAIVSSGYSQDAVMSDFEKFGFKGVLPKPFKIEELSHVLEKVLFS